MKRMGGFGFVILLIVVFQFCRSRSESAMEPSSLRTDSVVVTRQSADKVKVKNDVRAIFNQQEVPILCYHQLREYRAKDSRTARDYIVPVEAFRNQLKSLADSGYNSITPDQLMEYLNYNTPLPPKPVMLTFDDTDITHFEVAKTELEKHRFKGVFFIMTVSLGRPGYMSPEQVKQMSDEGHVIASHTWDHHNVKKYIDADWAVQIEKPKRQLEEITGKPVEYFAYPFGLWNEAAIPELKKRGMIAAFQLSTRRDTLEPLHTIRRIIVPGSWSPSTMHRSMANSFRNKI